MSNLGDAFTFKLYGPIVPKARPRAWNGRNLTPERYRNWKRDAISLLRPQYLWAPLSGVAVSIQLIGKHSRRGDADNIAGAILDALVQAEILKDDNLVSVHSLAIELQYSKNVEPYALISIAQTGKGVA